MGEKGDIIMSQDNVLKRSFSTVSEAFEKMVESVFEVEEALRREALNSQHRLQEAMNLQNDMSEQRMKEIVQEVLRERERQAESKRKEELHVLETKIEDKVQAIVREHMSSQEGVHVEMQNSLLDSEQRQSLKNAELEKKIEKSLEAIRAQMRSFHLRLQRIEETTAATSSFGASILTENRTGSDYEDLERRLRKLEDSIKSATEGAFPRVEAVLNQLEARSNTISSNDVPTLSSPLRESSRMSRSTIDLTSSSDSTEVPNSRAHIPSTISPSIQRRRSIFLNSSPRPYVSRTLNRTLSERTSISRSTNDLSTASDLAPLSSDSAFDASGKALKSAAESGNLETVRSLLDQGANINFQDSDGRSALHVAALKDHHDVVSLLLEREAYINSTTVDGRSVLHVAASSDICGHCVELILAFGADVNKPDFLGETPLHKAARNGTESSVQMLIAAGANVNSLDCKEETPLHKAARSDNLPAARLLVAAGASKSAKNKHRRTAHDLSRGNAMDEILLP